MNYLQWSATELKIWPYTLSATFFKRLQRDDLLLRLVVFCWNVTTLNFNLKHIRSTHLSYVITSRHFIYFVGALTAVTMASSEQIELSNFIKTVHHELRNLALEEGFDGAWEKHCKDENTLKVCFIKLLLLFTKIKINCQLSFYQFLTLKNGSLGRVRINLTWHVMRHDISSKFHAEDIQRQLISEILMFMMKVKISKLKCSASKETKNQCSSKGPSKKTYCSINSWNWVP